ncbi:MAG: NHL repeat-containing protein, partial [Planctomycetota bacterium]
KSGTPALTVPFIINNTTPAVYAAGPASIANDKVPINFSVVDSHSDNVDILVQFSTDGGVNWNAATTIVDPNGYLFPGVNELPSSPSGIANVYYWNSFVDLPTAPSAVIFRIRPIERPTGAPGSWIWTVGFPVNNKYISTVAGTNVASHISALYASLKSPAMVKVNPSERVYILDPAQLSVRAINITALPINILGVQAQPGQIVTVAGNGGRGYPEEGVSARDCSFQELSSIDLHPDNSVHGIYIADRIAGQVYYIDEFGILNIVAGNGRQGLPEEGALARFTSFMDITDIAIDSVKNIYVTSEIYHAIWKIDGTKNTVERFAGFPGLPDFADDMPRGVAQFNMPVRIDVDTSDNLIVLDKGNQRIRLINNQLGQINRFGQAIGAGWINTICGNAWDGLVSGLPDGSLLDEGYDGGDGGNPRLAYLNNPDGLYIDDLNVIYVADSLNRRFRAMNPNGLAVNIAGTVIGPNLIETIAGSVIAPENTGDDGPAIDAGFGHPISMAKAEDGTLYFVDMVGRRVRTADTGGTIQAFAGGVFDVGEVLPADVSRLQNPGGMVFGPDGALYIADTGNHRVVRLDLSTATISVVAGNGSFNPDSMIVVGQPATSVMLGAPAGIAFDCVGNLYIAESANHIVRVVNLTAIPIILSGNTINPGDIGIIAGNGIPGHAGDGADALSAELFEPSALVVDSRGLVSVVTVNHIRIVNPTDTDHTVGGIFIPAKNIDNLAGQEDNGFADGPLAGASFTSIGGIIHDGQDHYFVSDGNDLIRVVNLDTIPFVLSMSGCGNVIIPPAEVGTYAGILAGPGGPNNGDGLPAVNAIISNPAHLIFDNTGDIVFVERGTAMIRHIQLSTGIIWTLSGRGPYPPEEDAVPAEQASFIDPVGIAVDTRGFMYISDNTVGCVRRFFAGP